MISLRTRLRFPLQVAISALVLTSALSAHADERFKVSADGQEVTDTKSSLTWRRCVEGMTWDSGKCTGKAKKMNFAAAQKLASAQTPAGWRVPTKDELRALVDKSKKKKPLIDTAAFPNTPSALTWAVRPESKDNLNAWIVDFSNGHVLGNSGSKAPVVRLVRSAS